jgi:hypothetical protein
MAVSLLAPVLLFRRSRSQWRRRLRRSLGGSHLLAEARLLNRAGYSVAAVVIARVAIERLLRTLVIAQPTWRSSHRQYGISVYVSFLIASGVVERRFTRPIELFARKANAIIHGSPVTQMRACLLLRSAAKAIAMLEGRASC